MIQDYLFPATVDEAVALLNGHGGRARIFAGGTDILLAEDQSETDYYLDLGRIDDLHGIVERDGWIVIGANTTHSRCAAHPLIRQQAPVLAEACGKVGSTQIRNVGTLAGNIVSANPAADSAVALTALEAVVTIAGPAGLRETPIGELYAGVGRSALDSRREVITAIKFPARRAGEGSAYQRLEQRQGLSLPMLCAAVKVCLAAGKVERAVVVAAPLSPGPKRLTAAEEYLVGKQATEEHFAEAGCLAAQAVKFRDSAVRCGGDYRQRVLPVLIRRALTSAATAEF